MHPFECSVGANDGLGTPHLPNRGVPETPATVVTVWTNSLVFIDRSCDIERKTHSSHSRCPPLHLPSLLRSCSSTPQGSLPRADKLIDQLSEWPFCYRLEITSDFFFLIRCVQVYVSFAWDSSGFGWWPSKSPFCRWNPTGGNYGSQLLWSSCGMAQLWEQLWLINQSCWRGAGGEHAVISASLHNHIESCS